MDTFIYRWYTNYMVKINKIINSIDRFEFQKIIF